MSQTNTITRDAVLIAHAQDYLTRTGTSTLCWAEDLCRSIWLKALGKAHEHHVPDLPGLGADPNTRLQAYTRHADTWRRRVERWLRGDVEFPAWLEEPWTAALPEPWAARARSELADRMGLLAAPIPEGCGKVREDMHAVSEVLKPTGGIIRLLGQMLDDGKFGPEDAGPAAEILPQIRQYAGNLISLARRIEQAVSAPTQTDQAEIRPARRPDMHHRFTGIG